MADNEVSKQVSGVSCETSTYSWSGEGSLSTSTAPITSAHVKLAKSALTGAWQVEEVAHLAAPTSEPQASEAQAANPSLAEVIQGAAVRMKKDFLSDANNPHSQKAKGVRRIVSRHSSDVPALSIAVGNDETWLLPYQLPPVSAFDHGPLFARPCPERPRHGFVDSRPVKSLDEVMSLFVETLDADPNGELLVMPFATARYSAVATHAGVTWSIGNDGATGTGKPTRFVPAPCAAPKWNKHTAFLFLGCSPHTIGVKTCAYLELVEDNDWARLVQMRDGPEQPTTVDWVPSAGFEVKNVLRLEGEPDLLDWEKTVNAAAKVDGTVLIAPGLGMSSHYAVHAIANGMPVLTSYEAKIGDKLELAGPAKLTPADYKLMALASTYWSRAGMSLTDWEQRGLPFNPQKMRTANLSSQKACIEFGTPYGHDAQWQLARCLGQTAVAGLHAVASWDNSKHLLDLRVFCAWALVRMLLAACVGELRHWFRCGPGRKDSKLVPTLAFEAMGVTLDSLRFNSPERVEVHEKAFKLRGPDVLTAAACCVTDFSVGWGGSFGGPAWHESAQLTYRLISALLKFEKTPTEKKWAEVLSAQNAAVHAAHNGGILLDKWLPQNEMNYLSYCPALGFCNALIGGYLAQQCLAVHRRNMGELGA